MTNLFIPKRSLAAGQREVKRWPRLFLLVFFSHLAFVCLSGGLSSEAKLEAISVFSASQQNGSNGSLLLVTKLSRQGHLPL